MYHLTFVLKTQGRFWTEKRETTRILNYSINARVLSNVSASECVGVCPVYVTLLSICLL